MALGFHDIFLRIWIKITFIILVLNFTVNVTYQNKRVHSQLLDTNTVNTEQFVCRRLTLLTLTAAWPTDGRGLLRAEPTTSLSPYQATSINAALEKE